MVTRKIKKEKNERLVNLNCPIVMTRNAGPKVRRENENLKVKRMMLLKAKKGSQSAGLETKQRKRERRRFYLHRNSCH